MAFTKFRRKLIFRCIATILLTGSISSCAEMKAKDNSYTADDADDEFLPIQILINRKGEFEVRDKDGMPLKTARPIEFPRKTEALIKIETLTIFVFEGSCYLGLKGAGLGVSSAIEIPLLGPCPTN